MAQVSGKGSIVLKLLIVILAVALILVIKIPAKIWDEEATQQSRSHYNMSSIYEAEKYYNRLTKNYTTDKSELLSVLKDDSTLVKVQKLVNYTQQLIKEIDAYFDIPLIKDLHSINQNITTIVQDLVTNERYFKIDKGILNEAEQLSMQLSVFNNDVKYPNYAHAVTYLDSLYELRRDLSDYNLQTAASRAAYITEHINEVLENIEIEQFNSEWSNIFQRLDGFRKSVEETEISTQTSVAARIREFSGKVNNALADIAKNNMSDDISNAREANQNLNNAYQTFLNDFIVTSKPALYRLSLEDSMVLYISDENFYSPVNGEQYKLILNSDSSDIKVESPMLLDELREKAKPLADQVASLDFVPHYLTYLDSLEAIHQRGLEIKKVMRRNIDITVKNKEIEERINKYKNGSEYTAAKNLYEFAHIVDSTQSYSALTESIEKARNAISIFDQVYSGNVFDNIDSLQADVIKDIEEYNRILSDIRRLPRGVKLFENEIGTLNQIVQEIKNPSASTDSEMLQKLEDGLEKTLLFANEGKDIRVQGVFTKHLQNFGYVYKNSKSWEEEEE
jgi:hypothetical protein